MRTLLFITFALAITGCTHDLELHSPEGQRIGQARLEFDDHHEGTIILNKDGVVYRGKWVENKVDESHAIAAQYGIGSHKYQNYRRGWVPYLYKGQATLQSDQDGILNCEFKYRGNIGNGMCSSGKTQFEFLARG